MDVNYKFSAVGKIRHSRHQNKGGDGWIVIDCPKDIVYYYNKVVNWLLWTDKSITTPLHGSHITVVAGKYTEVDETLWGYRDGDDIEFQYGALQNSGKENTVERYYWLPVKCDEARDIRLHYGLSPTPKFQYHLTIGHRNLLSCP